MDLSLDDIIQKRNIRVPFKGRGGNNRARHQGRGNALNRTGNTNPNKKFTNNRNSGEGVFSGRLNSGRVGAGRVNNTGRTITARVNIGRVGKINQSRPITDARQKIIQKNRQKLTDAREKLGEIAKQTDARLKLEKLRVSRQAGHIPLSVGNSRLPGRRNNDQQHRRNLQVPLQRTIRQTIGTVVVPNNWYRPSVDDMDVDMDMDTDLDIDTPLTGVSQVLRRTIPNEHAASRLIPCPRQPYRQSWPTQQQRAEKAQLRGFVDIDYAGEERFGVKPQANVSLTNRWGNHVENHGPGRSSLTLNPGKLLRNPNENHGSSRSSPSRNPRNLDLGYRIVISNLHTSVIHEDIQELFEDVGPLLESRLVRPGTAEVVFKHLKDAERAVEIYHNRQLDGQPMKCMLVNVRQVGSTTPPSHSAFRAMASSLARSSVKVGSGSKSAVVPDISTIHKALFNKS